jgi:hypothetical protein
MRGSRPQREAAARNERTIVDAAAALFAQRGVAGVEVRDIAPALDAAWWAETLLAPLDASLYVQQRRDQGFSAQRIADNVVDAARRLTIDHLASGDG